MKLKNEKYSPSLYACLSDLYKSIHVSEERIDSLFKELNKHEDEDSYLHDEGNQ